MENGATIPTTGTLVVTTCWCGIKYAVPEATMRWHRQAEKNAIHCPLGHAGVVRQTDTDRLRAAEARERHLEDQLTAAVAEAEAVRVRLVKDRFRFARGVCPCCNRSFPALARHMASEHPTYDVADLTAGVRIECSCGQRFDTPHGLRVHQGRMRRDGWGEPDTPRWRAHLTVAERG